MTAASLPLDGLRILAVTQLGAGPFGLTFVADLGAEVIKVEDPSTRGDEARRVPPFADPDANDGIYYQSFNRGTRSLTLNLRAPEGQALLRRLAARVDAVYNNLRGDLPGRLASTTPRCATPIRGSSAAHSLASAARAHAGASQRTTTCYRRRPAS